MDKHKDGFKQNPTLEDIIAVDKWARDQVDAMLSKVNAIYAINVWV